MDAKTDRSSLPLSPAELQEPNDILDQHEANQEVESHKAFGRRVRYGMLAASTLIGGLGAMIELTEDAPSQQEAHEATTPEQSELQIDKYNTLIPVSVNLKDYDPSVHGAPIVSLDQFTAETENAVSKITKSTFGRFDVEIEAGLNFELNKTAEDLQNMSVNERKQLFQEFADKLRKYISKERDQDPDSIIFALHPNFRLNLNDGPGNHPSTVAFADVKGRNYFLSNTSDPEAFSHELYHLLGLGHAARGPALKHDLILRPIDPDQLNTYGNRNNIMGSTDSAGQVSPDQLARLGVLPSERILTIDPDKLTEPTTVVISAHNSSAEGALPELIAIPRPNGTFSGLRGYEEVIYISLSRSPKSSDETHSIEPGTCNADGEMHWVDCHKLEDQQGVQIHLSSGLDPLETSDEQPITVQIPLSKEVHANALNPQTDTILVSDPTSKVTIILDKLEGDLALITIQPYESHD